MEFRAFKTNEKDFGLLVHDNGYRFTACCKSEISSIDAENGKLFYRGYPIEQLWEHSSFLEVAFLLIHGELPSSAQAEKWEHKVLSKLFISSPLSRHEPFFLSTHFFFLPQITHTYTRTSSNKCQHFGMTRTQWEF
jgi:citrate synthase